MKDKIKNLVEQYPKHYVQMIKRDATLLSEVCNNSGIAFESTIPEHVRSYLTGDSNICLLGKKRKLKNIADGYGFCGRAGVCECARSHVSSSVSNTKKEYSSERKYEINQKRVETNLQKYGVSNTGQTENARKKHRELYSDTDRKTRLFLEICNTLTERYGVDNPRKIPGVNEKIISTLIERYGVDNISKIPGVTDRTIQTKIEKYGSFSDIYLKKSFRSIQEKLVSLNIDFKISENEYTGVSSTTYEFRCIKCGHEFQSSIDNGKVPQCRQCNPVYGSKEQMEVYNYIRSIYQGHIIVNDRTAMPDGKELDIYLPELNLAIEYNGLYWHNDTRISNDYHFNKFTVAKSAGIHLIQIFSDVWNSRREVVERFLNNKIIPGERIYARNCDLKSVLPKDASAFLDKYHLQGASKSPIAYGLYHKNTLVSVMVFSKPRLGVGKNQSGYELVRFASAKVIVGGASKLLAAFLKDYPDTKEVYSFSDNTYSLGDLYQKLGFEYESDIPPSYYYVGSDFSVRHHRFKFRKASLRDMGVDTSLLTEKQIMIGLGYVRVYDAGKVKWVYRVV